VRRFNLYTSALERDGDEPPGYDCAYAKLGPHLGAKRMAGGLYELAPGQSNCPYHYEHGDEEWLIVLDGQITVRHPEGDSELGAGDVVCFVAGPQGAHQIRNTGDQSARCLFVSTAQLPAVAVYPDSDKIGVFTCDRRDDVMVRRESSVDYWEGER
jgi:uncharacterized cupin superfamily protein